MHQIYSICFSVMSPVENLVQNYVDFNVYVPVLLPLHPHAIELH